MPLWWASDFEALYNHSQATISLDCITDAEVLTNSDREKLCTEIGQFAHFYRW